MAHSSFQKIISRMGAGTPISTHLLIITESDCVTQDIEYNVGYSGLAPHGPQGLLRLGILLVCQVTSFFLVVNSTSTSITQSITFVVCSILNSWLNEYFSTTHVEIYISLRV